MKAAADAARSGRFDAVVAAGGDGTIHDVAEGLIGCSTPLGIVPLGTGNVLAREIQLPWSPNRLAGALLEGEVHSIPVGQVNGRPFLFVVGVGFDAEAVRIFELGNNRKIGQVGFAWPVLRALVSSRDWSLRVTTPRGETHGQWIIVTRIRHYAGNLVLVPHANLHESKLYVVRVTGSGRWNRARQLAALATGCFRFDPGVSIEVTDTVSIEGDKAVAVQIDGEVLGELPLEISLHTERLAVIFGRQQS